MDPVVAPSQAHQHEGRLRARVRAALSELAALPGSSDALVARMALANVAEKIGVEKPAAPLRSPPTPAVTGAAPRPEEAAASGYLDTVPSAEAGVAPEVLRLGVTTAADDGRVGTEVKGCSDCAEIVRFEARICRFCDHEFWPLPSADGSARGRFATGA